MTSVMYTDYYYYADLDKRAHGGLYNSKYEELSSSPLGDDDNDSSNENDSPYTPIDTDAGTTTFILPTKTQEETPPTQKAETPHTNSTNEEALYSDLSLADALSPKPTKLKDSKTTTEVEIIVKGERPLMKKQTTEPTLHPNKHIELLTKRSDSLQPFPVITLPNKSISDSAAAPKSPRYENTMQLKPFKELDSMARLITQVDSTVLKDVLIARLKGGHSLDGIVEALKAHQETKPAAKNKGRKWNAEFQKLLDTCDSGGIGMEEMRHFSELGYDFVRSAETYAKIIVDELWMDNEFKTIKRASVGGVAGGEKYIVHGILFKFCLDQVIETQPEPVWMYGGKQPSDEYAMKVGGLEMQGLDIWQINSMGGAMALRVPLMALIDYKGFRLVATSLLPIDRDSLRYGSNDGGRTVIASDPKLNELIANVGSLIHLKPHTVGRNKTPLHAPGDIEGHLGKDGRYYLLDFARTMPPEAPEFDAEGKPLVPRGVFHRLLRPELVLTNPVPLSPDVFSGWGERDDNKKQSQQEVVDATKRIHTECIPALIKELEGINIFAVSGGFFDKRTSSAKQLSELLEVVALPYRMHKRGINLRHMGYLRQQMTCPGWREIILSQALARLIKSDLRTALRSTLRTKRTSDVACQTLVAEYLTLLLKACRNPSKDVDDHTCQVPSGKPDLQIPVELERKFPGILTEEEKNEPLSEFLHKRVSPKLVVFECLNLKMFKLSPYLMKHIAIAEDITSLYISAWDVTELCTNVRFSLFIWLMKTLHLQMSARSRLGDNTPLLISKEYSVEVQQKNQENSFQHRREQCVEWMARERKKALLREQIAAMGQIEEAARLFKELEEENKVLGWEPKDEQGRELSKDALKKARKCLKRAIFVLNMQMLNYPLSPQLSLIYGDILQDIAKTYNKWEKIDHYYKLAYEKFELTLELTGPLKLLNLVWADSLKDHCDRADAFGHSDLARELWHKADKLQQQAAEASTSWEKSHLRASSSLNPNRNH